jgi:outer membrane scaffolding protein for murein synthesis (MipA/OmpV family)
MKNNSPSQTLRAARSIFLAAALAWLGLAPAAAAPLDAPTEAPAETPAEARLPLWELGVGAGAVTTPAYPGADTHSTRFLALPYLLYRGEVLRSDQSGIGARLLHSDVAEFDIGFAASLPAHSKDVAARAGMGDLGTLVEFGPRVKIKLADIDQSSRLRFELPLRAVIEARAGVRRQGWTLEPRLVYDRRETNGDWAWDAHLGAVFGDNRINRYFYQVQPQEATAARPAYNAQSGLMLVRAGLFASRKLNPDLRFFGFLRYESYAAAANRDSPLMKQDTGASAGFGFAWTFARSAARAYE